MADIQWPKRKELLGYRYDAARAAQAPGDVRTFVDPANPANEVSICPTCHCDDFDCRCERARSGESDGR